MLVSPDEIRGGIRKLRLSGRPVCLHSSLSSFGKVDGGATTVVDAFLAEGCTLLAPTFSWGYSVPPPPHLQFRRNAADYAHLTRTRTHHERVFDPGSSTEIDADMGAIAEAVLDRAEARRGNHPICSFSAIGPSADRLIEKQAPCDVYAPLEELASNEGHVVLAGVDVTKMTLIHLSEKEAGRVLFRRWANGPDGLPMAVEAGGCSGGFPALVATLSPFLMEQRVGDSLWHCYPASSTLAALTQAIRDDPTITHCPDLTCGRCNDAIAGGPILS
jgi:aminoglycoside 3-N-acetyltransferase